MEKSVYIILEDLDIYQMAMEIGDVVWKKIDGWDYFSKKHIGGQFVEAADSIAANIAEEYGRFHFNDKRNFYFFARGSLSETKTWLTKANSRQLISTEDYTLIYNKSGDLHRRLNQHIKHLPKK